MAIDIGIVRKHPSGELRAVYYISDPGLPKVSKDLTADLKDVCKRLAFYKFKWNNNE